jgi:hypothetical protein
VTIFDGWYTTMFIRLIKRSLKRDTAYDFKLLESYRAEGLPPKHRFIKGWTIKKSDIWAMEDIFLDDIEFDLDLSGVNRKEIKKIISSIRKRLKK